jgi:type I restriction enzyme S subunit
MNGKGGLKCVHYGDIYRNYSSKKIASSNIVNSICLEFPEHKIIKQNAIVIADVSETLDDWGHVTLIEFDGTPFINGTHTFAIVSDCEVTLKYMFYFLRNPTNIKRLRQFLSGITVFQMSLKFLSAFSIELPPLPAQAHITEILSVYDDAIENNNRRIALLEKAALELYREWFVRFRFPGHESARLVNGLPEGWEIKRLDNTLSFSNGKLRPQSDGKIPVYGGNGILAYCGEYNFEDGIIIGRVGAYCGSVFYESEQHWVSDNAIAAKPKIDGTMQFVYQLLIGLELNKRQVGTGQPLLTQDLLNRIKIVYPAIELQRNYDSIASQLTRLKTNLYTQSQNLARQRDLLLPRLMSGKLDAFSAFC